MFARLQSVLQSTDNVKRSLILYVRHIKSERECSAHPPLKYSRVARIEKIGRERDLRYIHISPAESFVSADRLANCRNKRPSSLRGGVVCSWSNGRRGNPPLPFYGPSPSTASYTLLFHGETERPGTNGGRTVDR